MNARRLPLVLLVATLALAAGCIGDDELDPQRTDGDDREALPDAWWEASVPSSATDEDHDHGDHAHHANLTTPNFEVLGWDPLVTDQHDQTSTGMMCGGATSREDGQRLALVHSIDTDMAFMLADVTDPEDPQRIAEVYMPNAVTWDADLSADGMHAIVPAYPVGPFGGEPTLPEADPLDILDEETTWQPEIYVRDACTGQTQRIAHETYAPYGPGLVLFGLEDPTQPTFEDYRSQPVVGPHSVSSHQIGDDVFATASVTNLVHEVSYYSFYTIEEAPTGSILEPHTTIKTPGTYSPELNGHTDVWVHEHPETGQTLAYLANWDGMYVYDISTPHVPTELASWHDGDEASLHTTYPFPETRDGRQYLIAGQEVGDPGDRPTGWIYLLDVTDPENPEEVSRWTLPVYPEWDQGGLQFSTHYVDVLDDTLFVSANHAGLWAVNVTDMTQPRAEGVFVPDRPSPAPWQDGQHGPHVGDVIADQDTGVLTAWDAGGGVYQLTYDASVPAPPAPAWTSGDS